MKDGYQNELQDAELERAERAKSSDPADDDNVESLIPDDLPEDPLHTQDPEMARMYKDFGAVQKEDL